MIKSLVLAVLCYAGVTAVLSAVGLPLWAAILGALVTGLGFDVYRARQVSRFWA
jgi:hypothetical protein